MSGSKKYDFNVLLTTPSQDQLNDFMIELWEATGRVCPKWRGHWPGGDTLVEWLYNERPEIARAIERKHNLYPETDAGVPLSYIHNFGN